MKAKIINRIEWLYAAPFYFAMLIAIIIPVTTSAIANLLGAEAEGRNAIFTLCVMAFYAGAVALLKLLFWPFLKAQEKQLAKLLDCRE